MLKLGFLLAVALIAAMPASAAPSWRDYKGISNTSFKEPSGDRALQLSIDLDAAPEAVFALFTTSDGFASWAAPIARVDLRVGGAIEANYDPKKAIGDPDNIINRIEAYVPGKLLVIRNLQTPASLPNRELFGKTVTVLDFAALPGGRTRLTLTNAGYGNGAGFDALYQHFEWGNAYTLDRLRQRIAAGKPLAF
jgi:uncharacterized protein YndB with AHSA1/START domain